MSGEPNDELGTISIQACPVELIRLAGIHSEALLRELTIIVDGGGDNTELPKRFLDVVEVVQRRAAGLNTGAERAIEAAIERGDETVDFEVVMPKQLGRSAQAFAALLGELDQYCRSGELLTLETSPEVRAFQRWYIDQIETQLGGGVPTPWPEWRNSEAGRAAIRS